MKNSDVLNRAADIVHDRGHTTGPKGWPGHRDHCGPVCAEGGIMAAIGMNFETADADFWHTGPVQSLSLYLIETGKLWAGGFPNEWSDVSTEDEVVLGLRGAAIVEAARELEAESAAIEARELVSA